MSPPIQTVTLSELIPIPWASIRAWVDSAEHAQRSAARGTTILTQPQLLALSQLVPFCAEPLVLPKDDQVGKLMRMSTESSSSSSSWLAAAAQATTTTTTPMEGLRCANDEACSQPEFAQGNRLDQPAFRMCDPVDVPHKGAMQLRWRCECVLPWCGESFPKTKEGAPPALFTNKKDAKQYAAMQAMAFLTRMTKELPTTVPTPREDSPPSSPPTKQQQTTQLPPQHLPPPQPAPQPQQRPEKQPQPLPPSHLAPQPKQDAELLPTSNRPITPPPRSTVAVSPIAAAPSTPPSFGGGGVSRPKRPLDSPDAHSSHRVSPLKQRRHPPSSTPSPEPAASAHVPFASPQGGRGADAAAEQQRLFDAIRRLCGRLGVAQPAYRLTQPRPNFFSGRAEFPPASRVPEDVAVVRDVLGKRQARIQIAAKVLAWMEREEAKRTAQTDSLLQ